MERDDYSSRDTANAPSNANALPPALLPQYPIPDYDVPGLFHGPSAPYGPSTEPPHPADSLGSYPNHGLPGPSSIYGSVDSIHTSYRFPPNPMLWYPPPPGPHGGDACTTLPLQQPMGMDSGMFLSMLVKGPRAPNNSQYPDHQANDRSTDWLRKSPLGSIQDRDPAPACPDLLGEDSIEASPSPLTQISPLPSEDSFFSPGLIEASASSGYVGHAGHLNRRLPLQSEADFGYQAESSSSSSIHATGAGPSGSSASLGSSTLGSSSLGSSSLGSSRGNSYLSGTTSIESRSSRPRAYTWGQGSTASLPPVAKRKGARPLFGFSAEDRERELHRLEEEAGGPINRLGKRRLQNRIAQRSFRARSKVITADLADHTSDLEHLKVSQEDRIARLLTTVESQRVEILALRERVAKDTDVDRPQGHSPDSTGG